MEKRTLLAILLMFALYFVFNQFIWKPAPVPEAAADSLATQTAPVDSVQQSAVFQPSYFGDSLRVNPEQTSIITLENEVMKVDFSTLGGAIAQVMLKEHVVQADTLVTLIPQGRKVADLTIFHPATQSSLKDVNFNYSVSVDSLELVFYLGDEATPVVRRSYRLDDKYGIHTAVNIQNMGNIHGLALDFDAGIADSETYTKYKAQDYKFVYCVNNESQKLQLAKLKKKPVSGSVQNFSWAALRSKYFTIALAEREPNLINEFNGYANSETGNPAMNLSAKSSAGKVAWDQEFLIYAGPADYDILSTYGQQMDQIAERGPGWLRWLANLIANFLKFLHKYLPNYGLVIIVFSLILSLILTSIQQPLTRKGMEANLQMQEIQPQMEAIRKKYPNDMEAQRREMVKLQQEHGVNVFGGCIMWIPLLINMPILISLYNVLRYTLDMRNASFILWWKDLSLPDKYYVLPILMSVVMIVQSRFVKPPTPDESKMTEQQKQAQQTSKMMSYIMPVMMFFIFKGLPSGLVLYYTVYSIFSAFRQYSLQKKIKTKDTITK
jgi:YidC/Oxa1 family membrane protein insertase